MFLRPAPEQVPRVRRLRERVLSARAPVGVETLHQHAFDGDALAAELAGAQREHTAWPLGDAGAVHARDAVESQYVLAQPRAAHLQMTVRTLGAAPQPFEEVRDALTGDVGALQHVAHAAVVVDTYAVSLYAPVDDETLLAYVCVRLPRVHHNGTTLPPQQHGAAAGILVRPADAFLRFFTCTCNIDEH
jgi:hypothetical protein